MPFESLANLDWRHDTLPLVANEIRNRLRLAGTLPVVPIVNQHVPIHSLSARINRGQRPRVQKMNVARPITLSVGGIAKRPS